MPLLDRAGLKADPYTRTSLDALGSFSHALVAWPDVPEALARRFPHQSLGAEVENALKAADIQPVQHQLDLIAIDFPSSSDGRGFSLARQLRNLGYSGTLRAVGPLIADQFAYALACGFDEVEPPATLLDRQPVASWLEALRQISASYQRGYGDAGNILDQRRAALLARKGGAA
jgi:uncharacterized protein (DUF934 family)